MKIEKVDFDEFTEIDDKELNSLVLRADAMARRARMEFSLGNRGAAKRWRNEFDRLWDEIEAREAVNDG